MRIREWEIGGEGSSCVLITRKFPFAVLVIPRAGWQGNAERWKK